MKPIYVNESGVVFGFPEYIERYERFYEIDLGKNSILKNYIQYVIKERPKKRDLIVLEKPQKLFIIESHYLYKLLFYKQTNEIYYIKKIFFIL